MKQPKQSETRYEVTSVHRARLLELEIEHLGRKQQDAIERLYRLRTAAQEPRKAV
jgi:hypothetical protein